MEMTLPPTARLSMPLGTPETFWCSTPGFSTRCKQHTIAPSSSLIYTHSMHGSIWRVASLTYTDCNMMHTCAARRIARTHRECTSSCVTRLPG